MTACKVCPGCRRPLPLGVFTFKAAWLPREYEVFLFIGRTGSGKSWLLKDWLAFLIAAGVSVFVIDVADEYSQLGDGRGGRVRLGPLRDRMRIRDAVAKWRQGTTRAFITAPRRQLALVPSTRLPGQALEAEIRSILPILYRRGRCVILFEEVHKYGEALAPELYQAAGELGKDLVVPMFATQYPGGLPEVVRKQVSTWVAGEVGKASDREMCARECGAAFAAALEHPPARTFHVGFNRPRFADGIPL